MSYTEELVRTEMNLCYVKFSANHSKAYVGSTGRQGSTGTHLKDLIEPTSWSVSETTSWTDVAYIVVTCVVGGRSDMFSSHRLVSG